MLLGPEVGAHTVCWMTACVLELQRQGTSSINATTQSVAATPDTKSGPDTLQNPQKHHGMMENARLINVIELSQQLIKVVPV